MITAIDYVNNLVSGETPKREWEHQHVIAEWEHHQESTLIDERLKEAIEFQLPEFLYIEYREIMGDDSIYKVIVMNRKNGNHVGYYVRKFDFRMI